MASRKARTYESLKFQRPQTKASILAEAGRHHSLLHALGPLCVFVYSRHGEETFWQPVTHAKTRTKSDAIKKKTYIMIFFFSSQLLHRRYYRDDMTRVTHFSSQHNEQLQMILYATSEQDSGQPPQPWLTPQHPRVSLCETQHVNMILAGYRKLSYYKIIVMLHMLTMSPF